MSLGPLPKLGGVENLIGPAPSEPEEDSAASGYRDVQLDPDRSLEMLDALGVEVISQNGDEVLALCPMHKERTGKDDHDPSWGFNIVTGVHNCFACGYSGGAVRLVADVRKLETRWGLPDWDAAVDWIHNFELDLESRSERARITYQSTKSAPKLAPMTEARLALFDAEVPRWALKARKIDQEACTRYGVLWDAEEECWITPLRDPETKKLIGFQQKGQGNRYFRNRPPGMKKSQTLFGIDAFEGGTMIVVESPLDCLRLDVLGYTGAVSTCGAKVSPAQVELMSWRADHVVMALDNDPAGVKALMGFEEMVKGLGMSWSALNYSRTDHKDVGDMSDAEVEWAMDHAVPGIYGMGAILDGRASLKAG